MDNPYWFDAPASRIGPPIRLGGTNVSVDNDTVWLVQMTPWADPTLVRDSMEILGFMGSSVEGAAYVALSQGARLPRPLELWATTREVPAADLGPGSPTAVTIDGRAVLAASWAFEWIRATFTLVDACYLCTLAPADAKSPLRIVTIR